MERIEDCVSFLLGKAYQQISAAAKRRLGPHGVTPVQYAVLSVLAERDGQSGAALGERLRLDSATITGVLDRLAAAQLIERQADPVDRRVNRLRLTPHGRALQPALDQEMAALNAEVFGAFTPDDAQRLRTQLEQLGAMPERP